jgi:hypothetical protein
LAAEVLVEAPGAPFVPGGSTGPEAEAVPETFVLNDMPTALREISFIWKSEARATSVSGYEPIIRCASCVGRNGLASDVKLDSASSVFVFPDSRE